MLSIREQLQALGVMQAFQPIKGGYKEPLIFLKVSKDVLDKCRCTKYGHPRVTRKPKDFRPQALRAPIEFIVETPIVPADSPIPHSEEAYGVEWNAVA
jgi:hypothetical protein